jgi:serine phosphatase RsbU (regulator of sigma subunit)
MKKQPKVRYKIFRILIISSILNVLLIMPVSIITFIKHSPEIVKNQNLFQIDTVIESKQIDSIGFVKKDTIIAIKDTLVSLSDNPNNKLHVGVTDNGENLSIQYNPSVNKETDSKVGLIVLVFILIFLAANIPFKLFFRKKRKEKDVPKNIEKYTRKFVQYSPLFNSLMLFAMNLTISVLHLAGQNQEEVSVIVKADENFFIHSFVLSLLSSALISAFAYFWMSNRLYYKYLSVIYTADELKKPVLKFQTSRVRFRMISTNIMTSLLPIAVVLFYIFFSISKAGSLNIENLSGENLHILLGKYYPMLDHITMGKLTQDSSLFLYIPYINGIDTLLMFWGIGSSIVIALIFVVAFIKWTTLSIVMPVKSLLESIEKTSAGETEIYTTVYTNDEIGKLGAGYNIMSGKLHQYISEIKNLNETLEQKVIERTATIQQQKEEIETQRDEIEAQRNMAVDQRDMIISQKKEITDSIHYALRIQIALLPTDEHMKQHIPNHFLLDLPRDIVSGDFYWIQKTSGHLIVAVGDCTGHGVPGGFMSMLALTFLNETIIKEQLTDPALILNNLRKSIVIALKQHGAEGEAKDGMDISIISINNAENSNTRTARWAGANNPLWIVTSEKLKVENSVIANEVKQSVIIDEITSSMFPRNDENLIEIKGDKMPIAIYERMDSFTGHDIVLENSDMIYLFTDGYADQFGGPGTVGKKFKYGPFKKLITEISTHPVSVQRDILYQRYEEWKNCRNQLTGKTYEQIDDICILGFNLKSE